MPVLHFSYEKPTSSAQRTVERVIQCWISITVNVMVKHSMCRMRILDEMKLQDEINVREYSQSMMDPGNNLKPKVISLDSSHFCSRCAHSPPASPEHPELPSTVSKGQILTPTRECWASVLAATAGRTHTNTRFLSLTEHLCPGPEHLSPDSVKKELRFLLAYWRGATAASLQCWPCVYLENALSLCSHYCRGGCVPWSPQHILLKLTDRAFIFWTFPKYVIVSLLRSYSTCLIGEQDPTMKLLGGFRSSCRVSYEFRAAFIWGEGEVCVGGTNYRNSEKEITLTSATGIKQILSS